MIRAISCVDFCRRTLGIRLTSGQHAMIAVAIDHVLPSDLEGPVRTAALAMFGDLDAVPVSAYRTVVACLGRDAGKTELGAAIALFLLLTIDGSRAGPGDVIVAAFIAPRTKTARIALRRAIARVRRTAELARLIVGQTNDGFLLRRPQDGRTVAFEVFAASRGGATLRGPSFACVIFDEASQFRDEAAVVNDEEHYAAVMPRLLPGGLVLFLSTPWSEEGLFWKLFSANAGAPKTAIVAHASTELMRDYDQHHVDLVTAEWERDAENAAREHGRGPTGPAFMTTGGSLFLPQDAITDAIVESLPLPGLVLSGDDVAFAMDLGLISDSSALAGVAVRDHRARILDLLELRPTRGTPLKLSAVISDFGAVLARYKHRRITADGHVREPAREYTDPLGLSIESAPEGNAGKWDTYVALRKAFIERRIEIPQHPRLLAQLRSVQSRPLPGGISRIFVPRRVGTAHADIVSAVVLAHWTATEMKPTRIHPPRPYVDFWGPNSHRTRGW